MSAKILVVDDSPLVRAQVSATLVLQGCAVTQAHNGLDAIAKIDALGGADIVVCDVNMPLMGGLEFLQNLRRHPVHAGTSVVMLTTEGNHECVLKAKELGVKGWIMKPFKMNVLLAVVKRILEKDGHSTAIVAPPDSTRE
jgi:two-component system chemotaxis response regulator CheY